MKVNKKLFKSLLIIGSLSIVPVLSVSLVSCNQKQPSDQKPSDPGSDDQKPPIDKNPLDEIKNGGNVDNTNLYTDKYAKVVSLLNLNENDILNKTIDQKINTNNIHENQDFQNIQISLNESNLQTGITKLSITGTYKNTTIPETIIEISNFNKAYDFKKTYSNFQVGVNWNNFFQNKQTNENVDNWTFEDLKKYLSSIDVLTNDFQTINLCDLIQNGIVVPNNDVKAITIENNILTDINLIYNQYSYTKQNGWYIQSSQSIKLYNGTTQIQYDNQQALEYVLNNQVLPLTDIEQHYFSWYIGTFNFNHDTQLNNFLFSINQDYYNLYTPNAKLLIDDPSNIHKINNNLEISVKLVDTNDNYQSKTFIIDNILLDEQSYIENNKNQPTEIQFVNDNTKTPILKSIKNEIANLDSIQTDQNLEINYKYMEIFGGSSFKNIYNSENQFDNKIFNLSKYKYLLFNQNLIDNIDLDTNIFDHSIGINQIYIKNNESTKSYLKKVNNNYYYYQPIVFEIAFLGDNNIYTIDGNLFFSFLSSDFDDA